MTGAKKNILVTIPVTEKHKEYLQEMASEGGVLCSFRYIPGKQVSEEDVSEGVHLDKDTTSIPR